MVADEKNVNYLYHKLPCDTYGVRIIIGIVFYRHSIPSGIVKTKIITRLFFSSNLNLREFYINPFINPNRYETIVHGSFRFW